MKFFSSTHKLKLAKRAYSSTKYGGVVQPGLEHPPVTRKLVGSNPIAPAFQPDSLDEKRENPGQGRNS